MPRIAATSEAGLEFFGLFVAANYYLARFSAPVSRAGLALTYDVGSRRSRPTGTRHRLAHAYSTSPKYDDARGGVLELHVPWQHS